MSAVFRLEPMTQEDVPEVSRVERRCFSNPWPTSAYRRELRNLDQNYYVVLRALPTRSDEVTAHRGNGEPSHHPNGRRAITRWPLLPFGRRGAPEADQPRIAGFAGMWIMLDEAHITTIGIDPDFRGQGLGELLLVDLFAEAVRRRATWLTLEVRVSNEVAQALYRKYGFSVQGTRRRYYSDNGEDALIMWSRSLKEVDYLAEVDELREQLLDRLRPLLAPPVAGLAHPIDGD